MIWQKKKWTHFERKIPKACVGGKLAKLACALWGLESIHVNTIGDRSGSTFSKNFPVFTTFCNRYRLRGRITVHLLVGWEWDEIRNGWDGSHLLPSQTPTNPRDFFDTSLLLYRKGMNTNHDSVNFWDSGRKSETFISYLPASFGPPNKSSIQSFRWLFSGISGIR